MSSSSTNENKVIEDTIICTACGGRCCQEYAGEYHPDDIGPITVDSLASKFADGTYAIDWWEGDVRPGKSEWSCSMFIRPAHVGVTKLRDPSWGGTCIHWHTVGGCCFEWHRRPKGCRELVPDKKRNCTRVFDKRAAALAWVPYQRDIMEAAAKIQD